MNISNEVAFQPIGYTFNRGPEEESSLSIIDNQAAWKLITKGLEISSEPPQVDFSQRKVVVIRSRVSFPHMWLIARKINLTATSVLQVLCERARPRTAVMSIGGGPVTRTQFVTIEKSVVFSNKEVIVGSEPTIIDPEFDAIEEQMTQIDYKLLRFQMDAGDKGLTSLYIQSSDGKVNPDDITDPEQKKFVSDYQKIRSEQKQIQKLFIQREQELSSNLLGPFLD